MKISFITTVFNEEKTIDRFLRSLANQTKLPDEIIIVDGGSSDKTLSIISNFQFQISNFKLKVFVKRGNRSVGRNEAIKKATGDIIVCSDSGNVLDKKWLENIARPFFSQKSSGLKVFRSSGHKKYNTGLDDFRRDDLMTSVDVVAGYYKGVAGNVFQKCLIPYALVMPDKVDPDNFLPATRSIAFTKAIWKKVGGFDEKYSHNEDYVFANKLKEAGATIVFAKDAIVNWIPRSTYKEAFVMFFRFAFGDAEAGICRTNVLLLFARYFLGLYFVFLSLLYKSFAPLYVILIAIVLYIGWAIKKNYVYVKKKEAFRILPLLQFTADAAVLSGTLLGVLKKIFRHSGGVQNLFNIKKTLASLDPARMTIRDNAFLFFILAAYIGLVVSTITWGIPNQSHPFPYHMDEWHQLHAVGTTFKHGTPNTEGSANGTMFHFLLSGFYVIPFALFKIVDPFALQIDNLLMREKMFIILRLQTILFGVFSLFVFYKLLDLVNASKKVALLLFTFAPIWIMLSGYFKYDIALLFWMILSVYYFLKFAKDPSDKNFVLAAIPAGLAVAVKVSAIPFLLLYVVSYFLFTQDWRKYIRSLFLGIGTFVATLVLFGFPDTLFGQGNILYYLYDNLIHSPKGSLNLQLGMDPLLYLFTRHFPIIFGHGLSIVFLLSVFIWSYFFFKEGLRKYKVELFLFFSFFVFLLSIVSINIYGGGNRSLVLLPFIVILCSITFKQVSEMQTFKKIAFVIISLVVFIQLYSAASWMYMRMVPSPQTAASTWVQTNIAKGETIGLENVPIYQAIPDIVQKEFYFRQYATDKHSNYTYQIIDSKSKKLPSYIIVSNDVIETKVFKKSVKKDLVKRLEKEKYKKIATFRPDYKFLPMTDVDFYFSWLIAAPNEISIYKKQDAGGSLKLPL